jgi:hypothetical protein
MLWDTTAVTLELVLWDTPAVVDSLVVRLDVCVGKTEELNVGDGVGDNEMDSDAVREAVVAVVREGEDEGVEAAVGERERLWLWLNVEDPNPDVVALEDMAMDLLGDMETLDDEEGVMLRDIDGETLELELEEVVEDILELEVQDIDSDGELDITKPGDTDTDWDSGRDGDTVTEGAREALLLLEVVRESVASADGLRDVLRLLLSLEDTLRLPLTDLVTVLSVDPLAVTLLDIVLDPVSDGVKLGDTGDFVREGVGVGDGMITVYDMKNTDPDPRLIMLAPIWDPPEL